MKSSKEMNTIVSLKKQVTDRLAVYHNGVVFLHNPTDSDFIKSSNFLKVQQNIEIPYYIDNDIDLDYMINEFLVKNIMDFYHDYRVTCNLDISSLDIPVSLKNDYKQELTARSHNWKKPVLIMAHYAKRFIQSNFLVGSRRFWKIRNSNPVDNFPTMILAYDLDTIFWDVVFFVENNKRYLDAKIFLSMDATPFILEFIYPENEKRKKI